MIRIRIGTANVMADNVTDSMHEQIVVANVIGMAMRADQISNVRRCQTVSGQSCRCAVDAIYGIVLKMWEGMQLAFVFYANDVYIMCNKCPIHKASR